MINESCQSGHKRHFYRFVKSLRKDPCGVHTLVKDGMTYDTNLDKANILNHFYSVFKPGTCWPLAGMRLVS